MSSSDNYDSEFDSDASEQEVRLYTQLYFGNEPNIEETEDAKDNGTYFQDKELPINCTTSVGNLVNFNSTCINNDSKKNDIQNEVKNSELREGIEEPRIYLHGLKRTRNPSICSIDSLSGKEPLDNLYCIDLTFDKDKLDTIDEDPDKSKCGSRTVNQSFGDSKSIDKKIKKNKIKKKKKLNKKIDFDAVDELSILPPPSPNKVETILLEDENSNGSSNIEVVACIKRKKSKARIVEKKKKKISKKRVLTVISDDDDNLDVSSVPLVFKLGSNILSTKKKEVKKSKSTVYAKSMIIFSKGRPLTKKVPSCPTWTQEMASLYDSDYSDEYSVEDIHQSQNSHPKYWKICLEDRQGVRNTKRRYFDVRCSRCREYGHLVHSCPRLPHCLYCSSTDHQYVNQCPLKCCLRCGKSPHAFCQLTVRQRGCNECGQFGHDSTLCPDLWRRYHATTSGTVPVPQTSGTVPVIVDKNQRSSDRKVRYCYNCAKRGHYGHECRNRRFTQEEHRRMRGVYVFVSPEIFSYNDVLIGSETNDVQIISTGDDIEIAGSCKKKVAIVNPHIKIDENCAMEDVRVMVENVALTKGQFSMFKQRPFILQEIKEMCKVQYIKLHKKRAKITIRGAKKALQLASDYVSLVMFRSPKKYYVKFMKNINERRKLQKKKTKLENLIENEEPLDDVLVSELLDKISNTKVIRTQQHTSGKVSKNVKSAVESPVVARTPKSKSEKASMSVKSAVESPVLDRTPKSKNEGASINVKNAVESPIVARTPKSKSEKASINLKSGVENPVVARTSKSKSSKASINVKSAVESPVVARTPKSKSEKASINLKSGVENPVVARTSKSKSSKASINFKSAVESPVVARTPKSKSEKASINVKSAVKSFTNGVDEISAKDKKTITSGVHPDDVLNSEPSQVITNLPLPFPRNKTEAIKTLEQVTKKMRKATLKKLVIFVLMFFDVHGINNNVFCKKNYPEYIQALARIVYTQTRIAKGRIWMHRFESYKKKLKRSKEPYVDDKLHENISKFYWRIANPPSSRLKFLYLATKRLRNKFENQKKTMSAPDDMQSDILDENRPVLACYSNPSVSTGGRFP